MFVARIETRREEGAQVLGAEESIDPSRFGVGVCVLGHFACASTCYHRSDVATGVHNVGEVGEALRLR